MYRVKPYPALSDPALRVTKALSDEQADEIRKLCIEFLDKAPEPGTVGFNEYRYDPAIRVTTVSWLPFPEDDPRTTWIYDMGGDVSQRANAEYWQLDLDGFYDKMHVLKYGVGGHFQWHRDSGDASIRPQRKLSFTVLLSDPADYDGGDFQIFDGGERTVKAKDKGTFIVFPSDTQHRVTEVTRGERYTLVGWIGGPKKR